MRGITTTCLALLAGAGAAGAQNSTACAEGLYIVVARGTFEAKGAGVTGVLANNVAGQVKGSTVVPLDYPASFANPDYITSVSDGVAAMQGVLGKYTADCPDGKVAVMGYSQGAQVSMDTICGGSGGTFDSAAPLAANKVENNLVAIVLFGDPTHRANTTYDKGTSINNGAFQRGDASVQVCTKYADRLVSYCDTGDVYCDLGADGKVHRSYVQKYGDDTVKYIVAKYNAAVKNGGGNSTAIGTATATTAAPTTSGSATVSGTARGTAAPLPTTVAASGPVVRASLYLGVPLAMLAMFQALW
ncbi:Acetylxylan esterase 2 [Tolypocladium capitatum]|uniref:Acetylxylan esterase 2 n=1 Tax=Tolypocladium capitatum TaxID=45235 RepID=A0A2K3QC97_9HYPO|nr:Acetylxylan esterase 2 [Tolypocladium capitatum]